MSSLSRELVFLILQFLDEEKFKDSVHKLEQESGFFFNMRYFDDMVTNGEWEEVEKYLSGFTKVDDNRYSMKIFFEIRKQKYLEALDKRDRAKAVDILVKDLKVFAAFNEELFKEITQLLTLDNFRDNEQLSKYGDTKSARSIMLAELKKLIEANPLFRDKLQFPTLKNSRLRTLINQRSLRSSCLVAPSPVTNHLMGAVPKTGGFPPLGAHGPFQPAPAALPTSLAGWMANPSPVPHPSASAGPIGLAAANNAAMLKRPRTPPTNNPTMDYQTADSEHVLKRSRPFGITDEANNLPVNMLPVAFPNQSHGQSSYSSDDLPRSVVMTLSPGSAVKSMDFHPVQQIILLVGTNMGDVMIYELPSHEKIAIKNFKVWDLGKCSVPLQASLASDYTASINRVMWSPDGTLFGKHRCPCLFSVYLILFSYCELDTCYSNLKTFYRLVNCSILLFTFTRWGNKKLIHKVHRKNKYLGGSQHKKKSYAVLGISNFNLMFNRLYDYIVLTISDLLLFPFQFIFSTATDGKIKAWLYDTVGSRVDYDAPGHSSTTMAYSADGTRLFSCGTNKEGDSYLVEWNESEGAVKRTYHGLAKRTVGVVQFDTTKNRFLAAGDEFTVKFWDMDNVNLLISTDADGGLPASPTIRFNKEGILLAASTNDNGIKILANSDGIRLLRTVESRTFDASRAASAAAVKAPPLGTFGSSSIVGTSIGERSAPVVAMVGLNSDSRSLVDVKPRIADESIEKSRIWKLTEINEPSQCRSLRLPDSLTATRVNLWKLCVWNTDGWEKQASKFLPIPSGRAAAPLADTRVQFHLDQTLLLAVHETQIAIYEAPKLECLKQWVPREASGPITHATYSCDSQSIYVSFEDGSVGVLTASTLRLRCRILPTAYLPPNPSTAVTRRKLPVLVEKRMSTTSQSVQLEDDEYKLDEPGKRRKIIKDDEHKNVPLLVDVTYYKWHAYAEFTRIVFSQLSPCLSHIKILKLDIRGALGLKISNTKMAKIEKAAECPHYYLKEVEISGYRGHKCCVQHVMYLKKNVIALEKIVINPVRFWCAPSGTEFNFLRVNEEQNARDHAIQYLKQKMPSTIEYVCL
ncbi:hypothetical protein GBA52_022449 [Prunus armeniaca]|nr:hypothetical protein GBA52_022449 [Prunus armeniaca]